MENYVPARHAPRKVLIDLQDEFHAEIHDVKDVKDVDELIAKFHRCRVFSIVDMKKGYWMVPLHPDTRPLTCMSIDIGRYQ